MRRLVATVVAAAALAGCDSPTEASLEQKLAPEDAKRLEAVIEQNEDGARWTLERVTAAQHGPYQFVTADGMQYAFLVTPAGTRYDFRSGELVSHPTEFYLAGDAGEPSIVVDAIVGAHRAEQTLKRAYEQDQ